jgi:hypothetical protein
MEYLERKDLFMGEQDVSIDEKLFMAYLRILWNQLTVSKFTNFDFFFLSNSKKISFSPIQLSSLHISTSFNSKHLKSFGRKIA